jgi:hypothetical protein
MNRLAVQEFLETKSLGDLEKEWGICARVSKDGHKMSLNYDMLAWTPGHKPTEQCRGLVVALKDARFGRKIPNVNGKPDPSFVPGETFVLAYPMDKFYNSEEGHAAKIDWNDPTIRVYDKLDGTLAILYWDDILTSWCVATRSVPDADLPIDGYMDMTFTKLFHEGVLKTTKRSFADWTRALPKCYTYCFELTSPRNRIMVEYKEAGITLLAVRNNFGFREESLDFARNAVSELQQVPVPKTWSLGSYEAVKEFVNSLSPIECEGAVVMDSEFRRIKIKSAKWLVANATKTTIGASPRNLVRYVLQGVDDDVRSLLPSDIQTKLDSVRSQIHHLFTQCDSNFAEWKGSSETRKHFAEMVNLHEGWQGPYFKLYEAKFKTTWEFVQSLLKSDKLSDSFIDGILKHVGIVGSDENIEASLPDQGPPGLH